MASDGCGESPNFAGFSLSLAVPTESEAQRTFAALADGGQVQMPASPAMSADRYNRLWP